MIVKNLDPYRPTLSFKLLFTTIMMGVFCGIPVLIFYCWASYFHYVNSSTGDYNYLLISCTALTAILLSILIICIKQRKQRNLFLNHFKKVGFFEPLKCDECKTITGSHYAGLDIKNGILLVIAHTNTSMRTLFVPKDYLVMGFDMNSFTSAELQGRRLTIYTGKPDIPFVIVEHKHAPALFERLSAMRNRNYRYENSVPGFVEHHARRIADEKNLNLVMSRFN